MEIADRASQSAARESVLVLEPNAATRAVLLEALEALGASTRVGPAPQAGGRNRHSGRPDRDPSSAVVLIVASVCEAFAETTPEIPSRGDLAGPPIVVTTATPLDELTSKALRRAFAGVIAKPTDLPTARSVLAEALMEGRRRYRDRALVSDFQRREASLSPDEHLVLQGVCEGKLNKQIARELGVSVRTVEQRRRRVFSKMDVPSAAPLAERVAIVRTIERMHRSHPPRPAMMTTHPAAAPSIYGAANESELSFASAIA